MTTETVGAAVLEQVKTPAAAPTALSPTTEAQPAATAGRSLPASSGATMQCCELCCSGAMTTENCRN